MGQVDEGTILLRTGSWLMLNPSQMKASRKYTTLLPVLCFALLLGQTHAEEPTQQPTATEKLELVSALDAKLDGIIIPPLQCKQSTLSEVVEAIRVATHDNDQATADPKEKGINIFIKCSNATARAHVDHLRVTLDLKGGSVRRALEAIYCQTNLVWHTEPYAASFVVEY